MKKLVWGVKAFTIWAANGVCNIVSGPFKTYFAAIMLFVIVVSLESCASRCGQQKRYWSKHRYV